MSGPGVRSKLRLAMVIVLVVAAGRVGAHAPEAVAAPAVPDHRLFVVSDSVVLGAASAIHNAFGGWNVTIIGRSGLFANDAAELVWNDRAAVGKVAVVAVGYNYPVWNPALFDTWIDQMMTRVTAAGAEHVLWVTLRNLVPGQDPIRSVWEQTGIYRHYPEANAKLVAAIARWPQLQLVDWSTVGAGQGLTWDSIHLNPTGAKLMAGLIHDEVYGIGRLAAGTELHVALPQVDAGASAVLNITALGARGPGFLTVHPCRSPRPDASTVNVVVGETATNLVVVPVDNGHDVCIYASEAVHVVVDLDGAIAADAGLTAIVPHRVLDTRTVAGKPAAGTITKVALPLPSGTAAAVLNVAVTAPDGPGYLTVYPCGDPPPDTSSVNFVAGQTIATFTIARLTPAGEVCIRQSASTHVFVDFEGSFAASGKYLAQVPTRLLDTRSDHGAAVPAGGERSVAFTAGTTASLVTITADGPATPGYVTAHACGRPRPTVSNLNPVPGRAVANAAFVAGDQLCVFTSTTSHLIVDRVGELPVEGFTEVGPVRLRDTRDDGIA